MKSTANAVVRGIVFFMFGAAFAILTACVENDSYAKMNFDPPTQDNESDLDGGQKTTPPSGPRPCDSTLECLGRGTWEYAIPECAVDVCVGGFCQIVYDGFGVSCGDEWWSICDGRGVCGEWLPRTVGCYAGPMLSASCPLCDDGDPATADNCQRKDPVGVPLEIPFCEHTPLPEGYPCGPAYTMVGGECCFDPTRVP